MSKFFMYGTDLHELEQLMMLVPNFKPRRSGVIVVKKVEKRKNQMSVKLVIIRLVIAAMIYLVLI